MDGKKKYGEDRRKGVERGLGQQEKKVIYNNYKNVQIKIILQKKIKNKVECNLCGEKLTSNWKYFSKATSNVILFLPPTVPGPFGPLSVYAE